MHTYHYSSKAVIDENSGDLLPFPGTLSRPEKEYLYVCVFVMYVNKFILYSLKCQFLAE